MCLAYYIIFTENPLSSRLLGIRQYTKSEKKNNSCPQGTSILVEREKTINNTHKYSEQGKVRENSVGGDAILERWPGRR